MRIQSAWKLLCCAALSLLLLLGGCTPVRARSIEPKECNGASVAAFAMEHMTLREPIGAASREFDYIEALRPEETEALYLIPGGMPFGVKFYTEGVTVAGFGPVETDKGKINPGEKAGLKQKDMILAVNGETLTSSAHLTRLIEKSGGNTMTLSCRRGRTLFEAKLTPVWCPGESRFKTGIWVRDSGAGIGTVTFILPDTGAFAGLGHGICEADTGDLVAMRRGAVADVTISSVVKGEAGKPGELKGYFNPGKTGSLLGNSSCGVWGVLAEIPESASAPIPLGRKDEIQEGDACILCTLDGGGPREYTIRIENIKRDASGSKCFTVKVTDPALLAKTGGIVQGMSGSPIIQNGKLMGAVTHVLINDPTAGYGIFAENMLVSMPIPAR